MPLFRYVRMGSGSKCRAEGGEAACAEARPCRTGVGSAVPSSSWLLEGGTDLTHPSWEIKARLRKLAAWCWGSGR